MSTVGDGVSTGGTDPAPDGRTIRVEIFSDVVCPWCYIGKRRFETALDSFRTAHPDVDVDVAYRAFQLDPSAPTDRADPVIDVYRRKFGGDDAARSIIERVSSEAAGEGLDFRLDIAVRSNTVLAHRLLVLAEREGLQHELKERLLAAYFTEGRNIGDAESLVEFAAEAGIDEETARAWLAGDGGRDEVADALEFAAANGITSVPTFVLDRRIGIPGAQPAEVFSELLERLVEPAPS